MEVEFQVDAGLMRLVIRDNGRGFAAVAKSEGALPQTGASQGLPNIKLRCERWGGTLDIQSIPAQGTIVSVQMPTEGKP